ncbi:la-related protein 6A isoform X1 [Panicum miliaceum]|uniref:La-related protein 6A isoform X1 n=1 Tax=Panicum miliaceum TaxID=4540 RepID=A0A3L6SPF1_PANMI|nr:la-related protein 6A isoform X1 [Panicum miliaceum]
MDGQAPPHLGAVAPEPLAVADELPPPPPPLEVEDALPPVKDGQAPPLDGVAPGPLAVSDEPPPPPSPTGEVGDALPVAPDTVNAATSGVPEAGTGGVELTDQIVKQVEYYFSDENLPTDEFLLKCVKKNKKGFVPIETIASFRRMKKLVQDLSVIAAALRTSPKLVVSPDGKRVRRFGPLPQIELKDSKKSTVLVENLPPDFSMESIQEKFGTVGKVVNITINDPELVKESSTAKKPTYILSSKVHALVEYEAVEAAEKAVTTLSDESNWRIGMKVRLLSKGSGKHSKSSKENQDTVSKKNIQNQHGKEDQQTALEKNSVGDSVEGSKDKENLNSAFTTETEHQHQKPNPKGGRKGQYKGHGQIQQNTNKQGSESLNKAIPGPRMPDGTKGFTMGRGRPLPLQKSEKAEE